MNVFFQSRRGFYTLLLLGLLSIIAIFSMRPGGIGGTGLSDRSGGIGGTGIYGRITGFGSIWVNGIEIHYAEDQDIQYQGRDVLANTLAIGQIVAVNATQKDGRYEATKIAVVEEVNGPIETFTANHIKVMGQDVIINDDTVIDQDQQQLQQIGSHIAVSGFRDREGSILATRISVSLSEDEMSLRGRVERVDEDGFWVEDQKIIQQNHTIKAGDNVQVIGMFDDQSDANILIGLSVKKENILPFDEMPEEISYQGLLNQTGGAGINIGNINLKFKDFKNINNNIITPGTKIAIISGSTDIFKSLDHDQNTAKMNIVMKNIDIPVKQDGIEPVENIDGLKIEANPIQLPLSQMNDQQNKMELIEDVRKENERLTQDAQDAIRQSDDNLKHDLKMRRQEAEDLRKITRERASDKIRDRARKEDRALTEQLKNEYETRRQAMREAEETAKGAKEDAREAAKDARENAREAVKDAREDAREAAKDARENAREAAKDSAKESREVAREAADNTRELTREAAVEARNLAREAAKEAANSAAEAAVEARNLAREAAKESAKEAVNVAAEAAVEARNLAREAAKEAAKAAAEAAIEARNLAREAAREAAKEAAETAP